MIMEFTISTLVIAEHDNAALTPITLNAISAARKLGGDVTCLVAGETCAPAVAALSKVEGISRILVAENPIFRGFLPEALTPLLLESQKQFGFTHITVGASAFGKNLLPRLGAKLDVAPISDIIGIEAPDTFVRTIYAGNAICTIKSLDAVKLFSVRGTAFPPAEEGAGSAASDDLAVNFSNDLTAYIGAELTKR
jgi:electron transfer flavoprotein alpha subunit